MSFKMIYTITCMRCEKNCILGKQRGDWQIDSLNTFVQSKNNFPGLPVAAHFNSSKHSVFNAKVSAITICANDTYRKTEKRPIYKIGAINTFLCPFEHSCVLSNTPVSFRTLLSPFEHSCLLSNTPVSFRTLLFPFEHSCVRNIWSLYCRFIGLKCHNYALYLYFVHT